jgi:hypothetical protein
MRLTGLRADDKLPPSVTTHHGRHTDGGKAMQAGIRQIVFIAMVAVASVVVLGGTALAQSNPFTGTWTLNVAKSRFGPGR